MLEAGIIVPITADKVKCISPMMLAQKAHQGGGLTCNKLAQRLNDQCVAAGLHSKPNLPPQPTMEESYEAPTEPPKWQICQNYRELNKVTAVPPMLQGNIHTKQQKLCRQQWHSVSGFTTRFYTVKVHNDTKPYLTFYDECKGFLTYEQMPFRLMGALTCFNGMTVCKLGDFKLFQLFIDDGGMTSDDFS